MQIKLLEKLLNDEVKGRLRSNRTQARRFSEEIESVLVRYESKQLSSAQVVERLVEIAKRLRDARRRHELLGLTEEEAAFTTPWPAAPSTSRPIHGSRPSPTSSWRASAGT